MFGRSQTSEGLLVIWVLKGERKELDYVICKASPCSLSHSFLLLLDTGYFFSDNLNLIVGQGDDERDLGR